MTLKEKLRSKIHMARWSLMLWATFLVAISLASWRLFPGAHFWADGGLQGIRLVTSVDLILGPVLFMLVANPAKSERARRVDFVTLMAVQLLAMSWGAWQVYTQRPVGISYLPSGFSVPLIMSNFTQQKLSPDALPASRLGSLPAFYVDIPKGGSALGELFGSDVPVAARAHLLKPLLSHEQQVFSNAKRFQAYWAGEGAPPWQAWTNRHGSKPATDYRFIILVGRYGNAVLILDQHNQLTGHIRLPGTDLPNALGSS